MRNSRTKIMAYNGLLAAIIVVMSLVPMLGFIQVGPVAIQLVSIPVIIGGILFGWKSALFLSLVFGLGSMFVAMTRGTAGDIFFVNPLVSVLPRVLFGLSINPIYSMLGFVKSDEVRTGITAFLSTLVHSVVVLVALFIAIGLDAGNLSGVTQGVLGALLTTNVLIEAIASVLVSIPVVKALKRVVD